MKKTILFFMILCCANTVTAMSRIHGPVNSNLIALVRDLVETRKKHRDNLGKVAEKIHTAASYPEKRELINELGRLQVGVQRISALIQSFCNDLTNAKQIGDNEKFFSTLAEFNAYVIQDENRAFDYLHSMLND